jgi:uroporphyrin-3 C-methyltransferase
MLLAPEQAFFVRENLKLRLLNARLALLSRQFDTAQADLQAAQATLDRYFDRSSRRHALAATWCRQVAAQSRQLGVPRPDDTLAALAAASAGR